MSGGAFHIAILPKFLRSHAGPKVVTEKRVVFGCLIENARFEGTEDAIHKRVWGCVCAVYVCVAVCSLDLLCVFVSLFESKSFSV